MRKVTCALLVLLIAMLGAVGTHAAQAAEPSSMDRSRAMFNLTAATAAALNAQSVLSSTPDHSRITPEKRNELVNQSAKLVKLARKLLKAADTYQPTVADPQYDAARALATHAHRQALNAYRTARVMV